MDKKIFHAYTQKWNGLARQMISDAFLQAGENLIEIKALWDTGASKTCISPECVEKLKLVPTGLCTNITASGPAKARTYLVDVILPNRVRVNAVTVTDAQIGSQGFDALFGMDLIQIGDFAVSNFEGKTVLTYRIPSKKVTDYVVTENLENKAGTHGPGKRRKRR